MSAQTKRAKKFRELVAVNAMKTLLESETEEFSPSRYEYLAEKAWCMAEFMAIKREEYNGVD